MTNFSQREQKKLLITGCGRSGTKYSSLVLRRLGLDIGHENMGQDGVASWYLAVNSTKVPFGDVGVDYQFEHVFHQVRHPLKVISSASTFAPESWEFICAHASIGIDEPLKIRCAKYWLMWNQKAENLSEWRFKVEDFAQIFPSLCKRLGLNADTSAFTSLSLDTNTRKFGWYYHAFQEISHRIGLPTNLGLGKFFSLDHGLSLQPEISWQMLKDIDGTLAKAVWEKSRQYGYDS